MASIPKDSKDTKASTVVVLGTGGTIAGSAHSAADNLGYASAQISAATLVAAVPPLAAWPIEAEQVAQVDSKDMRPAIWARLVARLRHHLARPEVAGVVVTHGTDTLEETALLLDRVVASAKPVVLTAAMRPATSLQADGPQNLLDAVTVAREPGAGGVTVVLGGQVWAGAEVRKVHGYRVDAFAGTGGGPVARVEEGCVRPYRPWPGTSAMTPPRMFELNELPELPEEDAAWPWVEIVTSHAGARAEAVDALVAAGVRGLVVAGTGNGSVHADLALALGRARAAGVPVLRASRCLLGGVVVGPGQAATFEGAGALTPAQARVDLMLRLLAAAAPADPVRR